MQSPDHPARKAKLQRRAVLAATVGVTAVAGAGLWLFSRKETAQPGTPTDRMTAELVRADARADMCSASNAVGVGLRGEYFAAPSLRGAAALVRVDDIVDFDQSIQWPMDDKAQKVSSVRWSGWIKPPLSGAYRFHADAPNMQVFLARELVAGEGVAPTNKVDLAAGRFYTIEIVVSKLTDSPNRIRLEWTAPHGARFVVPKALLHLPSDTVATPRN